MEVKDIARDTVYAAIGITSITAQLVTERAKKAYTAFETSFASTQTSSKETFDKVVAAAKERIDEVTKLNENVVGTIESQVPEQVKTTLVQLRTQVTELAEQVVDNGRKLVQRAA